MLLITIQKESLTSEELKASLRTLPLPNKTRKKPIHIVKPSVNVKTYQNISKNIV